jgi:hypothetical protein
LRVSGCTARCRQTENEGERNRNLHTGTRRGRACHGSQLRSGDRRRVRFAPAQVQLAKLWITAS